MDQRRCAKCSSMVDAAKAFCPDCGGPMVAEEQRKTTTEFNVYSGTDRITRSAYEIMMKEMELDISESPPIAEAPKQQAAPPKSNAKILIIVVVVIFAFFAIAGLTFAALFFLMR